MDSDDKAELRRDLARHSKAQPFFSDECEGSGYQRILATYEQRALNILGAFNERLPAAAVDAHKIGFAFALEESVNASVFRRESGGFWIVLNVGVLSSLSLALTQLWAHAKFLPHIGDVSKEKNAGLVSLFSQVVAAQVARTASVQSADDRQLRYVIMPGPECGVRQAAVQACHQMAFDMIVLHEYGHVLSRHLDLLRDGTGPAQMVEQTLQLEGSTAGARQGMELEADICSALLTLELLNTHPEVQYATGPFSLADLVDFWVVLQQLIMWMFLGHVSSDITRSIQSSHPHPLIRANALTQYLLSRQQGVTTLLDPEQMSATILHFRSFLGVFEESIAGTRFEFSEEARIDQIKAGVAALLRDMFDVAKERSERGLAWYLRVPAAAAAAAPSARKSVKSSAPPDPASTGTREKKAEENPTEFAADLASHSQSVPLRGEDVTDPVYRSVLSHLEARAKRLIDACAARLPATAIVGRNVTFRFVTASVRAHEPLETLVFPRRSGGHWIAMNIELLGWLSTVFAQLWSHRSFLPEFGSGDEESRGGLISLFSGVAANAGAHNRQVGAVGGMTLSVGQLSIPSSGPRQAALETCYEMAFDLVVMHSYGHIISRHLEMGAGNTGKRAFAEGVFRFEGSVPAFAHAMELEADIFSSLNMLERIRVGEIITVHAGGRFSPDAYCDMWVIALWMTLWLFNGKYAPLLAATRGLSHPHPVVRFRGLLMILPVATVSGVRGELLNGDRAVKIMDRLWEFMAEFDESTRGKPFEFLDPAVSLRISDEVERLMAEIAALTETRSGLGKQKYFRIRQA